MNRIERLGDWDRRLVAAAKDVKVLSAIAWPEGVVERFVAGAERGEPQLPEPPRPTKSLRVQQQALEELAREIDRGDPAGRFLADTAESYALAARLLSSAGTPEFRAVSLALYGAPKDVPVGHTLCPLEAAQNLIGQSEALKAAGAVRKTDICLTPEYVRDVLGRRFAAFFGPDETVEVQIDPGLASKAAAGAKRVRIRSGTCFSEADVEQLAQHEGFVHSATVLNGRRQPVLTALGLSSPRTTFTQEGIATFAELATHAMDLDRLRRIAIRIEAVDMALEGADYIEVYEHVQSRGQSPIESAQTAMRVFRGGDVRGGVAFTKDVVYLNGLIAVSTFLRAAVREHRVELIDMLFVGRLTLGDAIALEELRAEGLIAKARFVPAWARNLPTLTAYLTFGLLMSRIDMDGVHVESFSLDLERG